MTSNRKTADQPKATPKCIRTPIRAVRVPPSRASLPRSFWGAQALWYRWVPLLTNSVTVWLLVMLVALWAFHRRRERTAALGGGGAGEALKRAGEEVPGLARERARAD